MPRRIHVGTYTFPCAGRTQVQVLLATNRFFRKAFSVHTHLAWFRAPKLNIQNFLPTMNGEQAQPQRMRPPYAEYIIEDVCWDIDARVHAVSRKEVKVEILRSLFTEEEKFRKNNSVNIEISAPSCLVNLASTWRPALCSWAYSVVDHFGLDREIVSASMDLFDLVVSSPRSSRISKKEYVLFAVSSLYLAAKSRTSSNPGAVSFEREQLAELCQGAKFQAEDLLEAESFISTCLNDASMPPTSGTFVSALMHLCPGWTCDRSQDLEDDRKVLRVVHDVAKHLVEMSVFEENLSLMYKSSVVAYSAIICAMEALQGLLDLPNYARVRFLNNVAEASGLLPNGTEVTHVVQAVKHACPAMFDGDHELISEFLHDSSLQDIDHTVSSGRSSPIGVLDR